MAQRVRLRREEFESKAQSLGLDSQSAQARALRVHQTTHHRALKGQRDLSGDYVLRVLLFAGEDSTREDVRRLFELCDEAQAAS